MSNSKPNKRTLLNKSSLLVYEEPKSVESNLTAKNFNDEMKFRLVSFIETLIILDHQKSEYENLNTKRS